MQDSGPKFTLVVNHYNASQQTIFDYERIQKSCPMIIGGGGDARERAGRPFGGDLGGIRLRLLPHFRPWHHFQMVFMKVQICRGQSKTL